jgi:hypothetical protein
VTVDQQEKMNRFIKQNKGEIGKDSLIPPPAENR